MNTKVEQANNYSVVSVEGRVDTTNFNEFEKTMTEVIAQDANDVLIDCSGLSYVSSSGLRVFLIVLKKLTASKRKLTLCSVQPGIREVFEISGLISMFHIVPDRSSVIA